MFTVEIMFCRVLDKGFVIGKPRNLTISSDDRLTEVARPMKGDKLLKRNVCSSGGDKYMSCIKVRHSPLSFCRKVLNLQGQTSW